MISVCVPTYNGMSYIAECIESILNQTFCDFEVIISDDSSSDETSEYIFNCATQDRRIKAFCNEHRLGLVGNWNRCLQQAQGEWVKFVFQDDLLRPNCLARMHEAAQRAQAKFLACRRDFIFETGTLPEKHRYYTDHASQVDCFFAKNVSISTDDFVEAFLREVGINLIGEPTATLIHRDVFDQCGLYNEHLIMCCDSEFSYRAGSAFGVTYVPETLVSFRVHDSSASSQNFSSRAFRMNYLDKLVVCHEFLFSRHYDVVRKIAIEKMGPDFLRRLYLQQIALVSRTLGQIESLQDCGSTDCRQEWMKIRGHFSDINRLAHKEDMKHKIKSFLERLVHYLRP